MSQAVLTSTTSRRSLLAGLAVSPMIAAPAASAASSAEHADPTLLAMIERCEALWHERGELLRAEREDEALLVGDQEWELTEEILDMPARTLADLAAKTRLILLHTPWPYEDLATATEGTWENEGMSEGFIALNILSDLLRLQAGG